MRPGSLQTRSRLGSNRSPHRPLMAGASKQTAYTPDARACAVAWICKNVTVTTSMRWWSTPVIDALDYDFFSRGGFAIVKLNSGCCHRWSTISEMCSKPFPDWELPGVLFLSKRESFSRRISSRRTVQPSLEVHGPTWDDISRRTESLQGKLRRLEYFTMFLRCIGALKEISFSSSKSIH